MTYEKTDIRDGMAIDWDVPITMEDGVVLRADVYRPIKTGRYPVIMSYGPYAKWLQFQQPTYHHLWEKMTTDHPEVATDSSNKYQNWEVVDPEKWVRDGYVCVRIDSRGAGRSPGYLEIWSAREAKDYKICIEWGGVQAWSNGKVGLNGISYFGQNQWQVAGLRPKHLAAMCVWEGASDFYREASHHGGIYCVWLDGWTNNQIWTIQNGLGNRGFKSPMTGDWVSGPENLTDEELGANRLNYAQAALEHELFDDFWKSRHPQFAKIEVPLLSTGNWGGHGLHLRGNTEGFLEAGSKQKWLEIHGDAHWAHFYTDYGRMMQKRFFDYFLKGEKNGWDKRPKVVLQVRHPGEKFVERGEDSWPLARTQWTKMHLEAAGQTLSPTVPDKASQITYKGLSEGVTFMTPAIDAETEITGPLAAKLFVSSSTTDADLFLVVRAFGPGLKEITFHGANEPHAPIAQGWLRASHRKLDLKKTLPYRPYHSHDRKLPVRPGQVLELDIEIWPTSIVLPAGCRLALTVRGRDYVYPGTDPSKKPASGWPAFTGCGPFMHTESRDRPPTTFNGNVTLYTGPKHASYVMLPIIPSVTTAAKKVPKKSPKKR